MLSKGHYVVVITSCKGPLVVVITSYKGPMMVGSYVVETSLISCIYLVLRSCDGWWLRCVNVLTWSWLSFGWRKVFYYVVPQRSSYA
jgi:hypothetical protein